MRVKDFERIKAAAASFEPEIVSLLQNLVRIPSENHPPEGDERAVQEFYQRWLQDKGIDAKLIYPSEIPAFENHPARLREHDMGNRPNVIAEIRGSGDGPSLLVLAHADTEPAGELSEWNDSPFSGALRDGKVHGRGAGDDKSGMAIAACLPSALRKAGIRLRGGLVIASVADEERGGANGSAALLASGVKADAALYLDGSNQTIWTTGLGGGYCSVTVREGAGAEKLRAAIRRIKDGIKESVIKSADFGPRFFESDLSHGFYSANEKLSGEKLSVKFFMDTLPGDDESAVKTRAENIMRGAAPDAQIEWDSRFLKPSPPLSAADPFVKKLAESFKLATGREAKAGPGRQSDQGIISHFGGMPCVLFGCGRRGMDGAPHAPNEYILVKELMENFLTAALFAVNWSGVL
jgi:acetylornithine deacetylase/succinyl-diaminopimelate desuccinylase-like protein